MTLHKSKGMIVPKNFIELENLKQFDRLMHQDKSLSKNTHSVQNMFYNYVMEYHLNYKLCNKTWDLKFEWEQQ